MLAIAVVVTTLVEVLFMEEPLFFCLVKEQRLKAEICVYLLVTTSRVHSVSQLQELSGVHFHHIYNNSPISNFGDR